MQRARFGCADVLTQNLIYISARPCPQMQAQDRASSRTGTPAAWKSWLKPKVTVLDLQFSKGDFYSPALFFYYISVFCSPTSSSLLSFFFIIFGYQDLSCLLSFSHHCWPGHGADRGQRHSGRPQHSTDSPRTRGAYDEQGSFHLGKEPDQQFYLTVTLLSCASLIHYANYLRKEAISETEEFHRLCHHQAVRPPRNLLRRVLTIPCTSMKTTYDNDPPGTLTY